MKKTVLISSVILFFTLVPHALAQGFVPLAPIPNLTEGVIANQSGLATFFNNLYKYLIGVAATLAVIQIIWAGLDIAIFHKDAVSAITDDKGKIYNALFGLVLVLSPVLVFSIINPNILNLSLSLPELKTTPTATPTVTNINPDSTAGYAPGTTIYSSPASGTAAKGSWCYVRYMTEGQNIPGDGSVCSADEATCKTNRMKDAKPSYGGTGVYDYVSQCGIKP